VEEKLTLFKVGSFSFMIADQIIGKTCEINILTIFTLIHHIFFAEMLAFKIRT